MKLLQSIIGIAFTITGCKQEMVESPLQFTFSHELIKRVLGSTDGIMQVIDNSKIDDIEFEGMHMHRVIIDSESDGKSIDLKYMVNKETNMIELDAGSGIGFKGSALLTLDPSQPKSQWGKIDIQGQIKSAKIAFDMGYYKTIGENHIAYLKKMNLDSQNMKQLLFHIDSHDIEVDLESVKIVDFPAFNKATLQHIATKINLGLKASAKRRINLINDPKEVIESMDIENFSLDGLEKALQDMMKKLEFQLPEKLILPTTGFVLANHLASKITVQNKNIIFELDPRGFGLLSPKVQSILKDIKHPGSSLSDVDYSVTVDQNMLNSIFIEMSTIHKQLSARSIMGIFDKEFKYIGMMNSNVLKIGMPSLANDYGEDRQFDLVSMIDQETFLATKKNAAINGFSIDKKGHVIGTINFMSYLKLAPKGVGNKAIDSDDEDNMSDSELNERHNSMTVSDDWEVARTIYSQFQLKGKINIKKLEDGNKELVLKITSLDVSKLDFHKGADKIEQPKEEDEGDFGDEDEEPEEPKEEDDDEEKDSDSSENSDDEEQSNKGKTQEGGLIQALLMMQIQPRIKQYLPEFKHVFNDDLKIHDSFDCYGIHPSVPVLDYFNGGFILKGNYKDVPVDEAKCLELPTSAVDFTAMSLAPQIMRTKVVQLDQLHEFVDHMNPELASYFMKPTDMINAYSDNGIQGLLSKLMEKKDNIMRNVASKQDLVNVLQKTVTEQVQVHDPMTNEIYKPFENITADDLGRYYHNIKTVNPWELVKTAASSPTKFVKDIVEKTGAKVNEEKERLSQAQDGDL